MRRLVTIEKRRLPTFLPMKMTNDAGLKMMTGVLLNLQKYLFGLIVSIISATQCVKDSRHKNFFQPMTNSRKCVATSYYLSLSMRAKYLDNNEGL